MDDMDRRKAENVALAVAMVTAWIGQANDPQVLDHLVGEFAVEDRLPDALAGLMSVCGMTLLQLEKATGTPALTSLEQRASCLGPDRPDLQGPA